MNGSVFDSEAGKGPMKGSLIDISALPPEMAKERILAKLFQHVARLLHVASGDEALKSGLLDSPLNKLGLDSLMTVNLRQCLLEELGADVPLQLIMGGSTGGEIANFIYGQLLMKKMIVTEAQMPPSDGDEQEIWTL